EICDEYSFAPSSLAFADCSGAARQRGERQSAFCKNRLLSVPRPRGARRYGDRSSTESKPDHVCALCCVHSEADGRDAAVHSKGRYRSTGRGHLRVPAVAAETAGGGEYSPVEVIARRSRNQTVTLSHRERVRPRSVSGAVGVRARMEKCS